MVVTVLLLFLLYIVLAGALFYFLGNSFGFLIWGVLPIAADADGIDSPLSFARQAVRDFKLVENEATILIVRGFSSDPEKNTPSVTIATA
jgi:hypothetical protein